jgi:hypothetical protein
LHDGGVWQVPLVQVRPSQQGFAALHASWADWQVAGCWQVPLVQSRPAQQGELAEQLWVSARQVGAVAQVPLWQCWPQQSASSKQSVPFAPQLAAHALATQKGVAAQHWLAEVHAYPVSPQLVAAAQVPLAQLPEQQVPVPQALPLGTHAETA